MKVIFQQDVPGQGRKGEVKEVSDGYARNYLIPRKLAVPATEGNLRRLDAERTKQAQAAQQAYEAARALKAALEAEAVTIAVKTGGGGKLFGAVTAEKIAEALARKGHPVDRRKIVVKEPLRTLGRHTVDVKLHADVTARLVVELVEA
ncbi:MAG: 50S ribosomal protein L9 [Hydrogenibacillus sp.]|nr:50S ribosomal protein L9 [Hydrogenibacillus sp.]